jgi:hypothetical protein
MIVIISQIFKVNSNDKKRLAMSSSIPGATSVENDEHIGKQDSDSEDDEEYETTTKVIQNAGGE